MAVHQVTQPDGSVIMFDDDSDKKGGKDAAIGLGIFGLVWALLGIAAFVTSIVCWARTPSNLGANIGMFFVALFLGPLFWLVMPVAYSAGYCKKGARGSRKSKRSSR
jgi:hypothetical protein